jgi:hypothetical protein
MGLVVVPGQYIEKIEVEEFESQIRGRGKRADLLVKGASGGSGKVGGGEGVV